MTDFWTQAPLQLDSLVLTTMRNECLFIRHILYNCIIAIWTKTGDVIAFQVTIGTHPQTEWLEQQKFYFQKILESGSSRSSYSGTGFSWDNSPWFAWATFSLCSDTVIFLCVTGLTFHPAGTNSHYLLAYQPLWRRVCPKYSCYYNHLRISKRKKATFSGSGETTGMKQTLLLGEKRDNITL